MLAVLHAVEPNFYIENEAFLRKVDGGILVIFSLEILVRFFSYPSKLQYIKNPYSIIDIIAVVPAIIGIDQSVLFRLLRTLRLLRLTPSLKNLRALQYSRSVFQKILPIVLFFLILKIIIIIFEYIGAWKTPEDFNAIFAIIGFCIGVVLSLKLGATYNKYLKITEIILRLRGSLLFLNMLVKNYSDTTKINSDTVSNWARIFLELFRENRNNSHKFSEANQCLMEFVIEIEGKPGPLTAKMTDLASDAAFVLGVGRGRTPPAYDNFLHQILLSYLILIAAVKPGFVGLVTVLIATYVFYGVYYMTLDLDSIIGGEKNLVDVNIEPIEEIAKKINLP